MQTLDTDSIVIDGTSASQNEASARQPSADTPAHALRGAVVLGTLVGFKQSGLSPLVLYPGQPGTRALAAVTLVALQPRQIGSPVALVFEGGDAGRPMIIGVPQVSAAHPTAPQSEGVEVEADGERLILTAREQLTLQCGEASITLTKSGKVLIRGKYLSSQSTGVVRIKGGSIQLN
jgi:hypothetical protein